MDTVTQISLGAAVGEALLGKKIGNKAALYGAALGVVPDLDVVTALFTSDVAYLAIHRGFSHSLFFCFAASPLFGGLLSKFTADNRVGWKAWSQMVFWVLLTHILIDLCTSYGTQIFQPFSNYSVSFNSIFIIDPFYTLPLAAGVLTSLFLDRSSSKRKLANYLGLLISTLYLFSGFLIKAHVDKVFNRNFAEHNIRPEKYMTTPAPFTIFLWTGYAEEGDHMYAGLYSVFDEDTDIHFHAIPQQADLLEPYRGQLPVERLIWFSQGYYAVTETDSALLVHDLRFGRADLWLKEEQAPFIWNYRLYFNEDSTEVTGFDRYEPRLDLRTGMFERLIERIQGKK